jgi:hypothetical protein
VVEPTVSEGRLTAAIAAVEMEWRARGRALEFVVNTEYTTRMRKLARHAAKNSSTTNEPAYRLLQVLTRLRGGRFEI